MTSPVNDFSTASAKTVNTASDKAASFAGGDFQTFLTMLTTQIKNQDPMTPMDSADFAVQLATFSGVEQQVRTNDLLSKLAREGTSAGLAAYSDWIGKEVRTSSPVFFSQTPLNLHVEPKAAADEVVLVALDAAGKEVTRDSIGPGSGGVSWTGKTTAGDALPEGVYSFRVDSYAKGELIGTGMASAYAQVKGVESSADGVKLILTGDVPAYVDEVSAIRNP